MTRRGLCCQRAWIVAVGTDFFIIIKATNFFCLFYDDNLLLADDSGGKFALCIFLFTP